MLTVLLPLLFALLSFSVCRFRQQHTISHENTTLHYTTLHYTTLQTSAPQVPVIHGGGQKDEPPIYGIRSIENTDIDELAEREGLHQYVVSPFMGNKVGIVWNYW